MASDVAFNSRFAQAISFFLPFWMCLVDVPHQVLLLSQSILTSVSDHTDTSVCLPFPLFFHLPQQQNLQAVPLLTVLDCGTCTSLKVSTKYHQAPGQANVLTQPLPPNLIMTVGFTNQSAGLHSLQIAFTEQDPELTKLSNRRVTLNIS